MKPYKEELSMGNLKVSIDDQRKELAKPDDANIENFDEELVPFSGLAVSLSPLMITRTTQLELLESPMQKL